jgi:hypothetical protein
VVNADLRGKGIALDNDSIGEVVINGRYNNLNGMLTAKGNNLDPHHKIDFDLAMNFKDSANAFQDRITLRPNNFQLKYLERILGTLFTDMQGTITGNVNIVGEGTDREFLGRLQLRNAAFKVVFTQVPYTIEDTELILQSDYLDLSKIRLRDREGNQGRLIGGIKHKGFQDMYFDVAVQTVSPQWN